MVVVDDDIGIECKLCNFWFHCKSQNVSRKSYDIINEEADAIHWYCTTYNEAASNMLKIMTSLQKEQSSLKKEV